MSSDSAQVFRDSLSLDSIIQMIESHPLVAVIALVLFIVVLIILAKLARWIVRPVLKGVVAGGIVFAGLWFLSWKGIFIVESGRITLLAVMIALITAILDLNRKK